MLTSIGFEQTTEQRIGGLVPLGFHALRRLVLLTKAILEINIVNLLHVADLRFWGIVILSKDAMKNASQSVSCGFYVGSVRS